MLNARTSPDAIVSEARQPAPAALSESASSQAAAPDDAAAIRALGGVPLAAGATLGLLLLVALIALGVLGVRRRRRRIKASYAALLAGSAPVGLADGPQTSLAWPDESDAGPLSRRDDAPRSSRARALDDAPRSTRGRLSDAAPASARALRSDPAPRSSRAITEDDAPLSSRMDAAQDRAVRASGIHVPPPSERQWLSQPPPRSYKEPPVEG